MTPGTSCRWCGRDISECANDCDAARKALAPIAPLRPCGCPSRRFAARGLWRMVWRGMLVGAAVVHALRLCVVLLDIVSALVGRAADFVERKSGFGWYGSLQCFSLLQNAVCLLVFGCLGRPNRYHGDDFREELAPAPEEDAA